jgi:hypothetical protein
VLRPTAALVTSAGFLVVLVPLDVHVFTSCGTRRARGTSLDANCRVSLLGWRSSSVDLMLRVFPMSMIVGAGYFASLLCATTAMRPGRSTSSQTYPARRRIWLWM